MAGGLDDGHALKLKHLLCQSLGQRNGRVFSDLWLSLSMGIRRLVVALRVNDAQSAKICTALRTWRCHQQRSYHFIACELKMRTVITIQRFLISSQTSSIRARHKSQRLLDHPLSAMHVFFSRLLLAQCLPLLRVFLTFLFLFNPVSHPRKAPILSI